MMMKKVLFSAIALTFILAACGKDTEVKEEKTVIDNVDKAEQQNVTTAEHEWVVDKRLKEPTKDTVCEMCNMKVYTKDEEMGVFSAQAVKADGSTAFYDDIGCLLNAEYAKEEQNEKFVRDYNTLNWFDVEEAYIVKTSLKSPMNWGYIFFKYEEDATNYIAEHEGAKLTPLADIKSAGIERYKKKHAQIMENNQQGEQAEDEHDHDM